MSLYKFVIPHKGGIFKVLRERMDENLELMQKIFYLVEEKHGIVIEEELVEDVRKKGKHLFNGEVIILKPF